MITIGLELVANNAFIVNSSASNFVKYACWYLLPYLRQNYLYIGSTIIVMYSCTSMFYTRVSQCIQSHP